MKIDFSFVKRIVEKGNKTRKIIYITVIPKLLETTKSGLFCSFHNLRRRHNFTGLLVMLQDNNM